MILKNVGWWMVDSGGWMVESGLWRVEVRQEKKEKFA